MSEHVKTPIRQRHSELLSLLQKSVVKGPVQLASGKTSDFYIDARLTSLSGQGLVLIGKAFYDLLQNFELEAVGGPTLGADPIVAATAQSFVLAGSSVDAFIIRKEPKKHGREQWVEGPALAPGARVAILEDVCTTGGSALRAIEAMRRQYQPEVIVVSCLVDREEGAAEAFAQAGFDFQPLFRRRDFENAAS